MKNAYEAFVQVVESDTLVRAAQRLHVTQPTLSRQIQQLEATVGLPLFDRGGKRLSLTPAGDIVYQYARQLLSLERKLTDDLAAFLKPDTGLVAIACGLTPSIYFLPSVLGAYKERYRGVRFHVRSLSSQATASALLDRTADVGFVTTLPDTRAELDATPLVRDELLLVAATSHRLALRGFATMSDLQQEAFILMPEGSGLHRLVTDMANARNVSLHEAAVTDSIESISRLVQQGLGVSVLPRSAVRDDLVAGRLREVIVTDTHLGARTITMLTRKGSTTPAVAVEFAKYVAKSYVTHRESYIGNQLR